MYPICIDNKAIKKAMYKKRKQFMVIFEEKLLNGKINCVVCNKPIIDNANRVWLYPKTKKYSAMHYTCAWTQLLNDVYKLADKLF